MNRCRSLAALLMLACSITAVAQQDAAQKPAGQTTEPRLAAPATVMIPAEARQFDFLIGQWQVEVHPKVSSLVAMIHGTPHIAGIWTAVRAADGLGVVDDLRVVDGSGNPLSSNHSVRTYVEAEAQWKISGGDTANKRDSEAHGHLRDGVMILEGRYTDSEGNITLTRTRYLDITAGGFRMQQDRSTDNGQSWDENALTIDAKRPTSAAGS
ncbi:MAG: hypothetical protein ABIQ70_03110 [Dokdonella sp.]